MLLFSFHGFGKFPLETLPAVYSGTWIWISMPGSSTHSPLSNNPLLNILRCWLVKKKKNEVWGIWYCFRCWGRINLLVPSTYICLFRNMGYVFVYFPKKSSVSWKSKRFVSWVFYLKHLSYSSSFATSWLGFFTAFLAVVIIIWYPVAE